MSMTQVGLGLVVLAALFFISRVRKRRNLMPLVERSNLRVLGSQVSATLHPRMGRGCVQHHGTQFGAGFRVKQGPLLPHSDGCECKSLPFNFSSSEVFNGALRGFGLPNSRVENISTEVAQNLLTALKSAELNALPDQEEDYIASVSLTLSEEPLEASLLNFLQARYVYLKEEAPEPFVEEMDDGSTVDDPEQGEKGSVGEEEPVPTQSRLANRR